jgi:hypothetical protein
VTSALEDLKGTVGGRDGRHFITRLFQSQRQQQPDVIVILDQQDADRASASFRATFQCGSECPALVGRCHRRLVRRLRRR